MNADTAEPVGSVAEPVGSVPAPVGSVPVGSVPAPASRSGMLMRPGPSAGGEAVLEVRDLRTTFDTEDGVVRAVDGVSFEVYRGEVLAVVGESGCGKTVTSLSIMGLLPQPAGRVAAGEVLFQGTDVLKLSTRRRRELRGDRMSMIFQDPLTALNPVFRVGRQISEIILAHRDISKAAAARRTVELLDMVGIPNPEQRTNDYPHQFSGGMRQRAMIAMAIANEPDLLIADEPTTALDVTVQAQILDVLLDVRERLGMAMMLITHDLAVVAGVADRVVVMYAGKKIEEGDVDSIYEAPRHPYTWGLIESTARADRVKGTHLYQIPGAPPSLITPPPGCRFAPRCAYAQELCRADYPELRAAGAEGQEAACHFADRRDWGKDLAPAEFTRRWLSERVAGVPGEDER
jgi:oligopeptide/dipeptide ABC transporter ATP-binding protein